MHILPFTLPTAIRHYMISISDTNESSETHLGGLKVPHLKSYLSFGVTRNFTDLLRSWISLRDWFVCVAYSEIWFLCPKCKKIQSNTESTVELTGSVFRHFTAGKWGQNIVGQGPWIRGSLLSSCWHLLSICVHGNSIQKDAQLQCVVHQFVVTFLRPRNFVWRKSKRQWNCMSKTLFFFLTKAKEQ